MSSRTVLFVGQSHMGGPARALSARRARGQIDFAQAEFVWINESLSPWLERRDGKLALGANVRAAIEVASTKLESVSIAIVSVAGNHHNVLGLLQSERPFDFVLPEQPRLPLDARAEIVPHGVILDALTARTGEATELLDGVVDSIRALVDCPIYCLESPPPNPSSEFIKENLEQFYRQHRENIEVAPVEVRYKLWRLHSGLVRAACERRGVTFLPAPSETQDDLGYLKQRYWGDSTHGNEQYGEAILARIERL